MENKIGSPGKVRWRGLLFFSLGMGWLALVLYGMWILVYYQTFAGDSGLAPKSWPESSALPWTPGHTALIFWAHPRCPCTRASLGELAGILSRSPSGLAARVIFIKPAGLPEEWVKTDLWKMAAGIPGVQVLSDDGGILAQLFGVATSGHVLLYSTQGRLVFSGGITAARGHEGGNAGRDAILSFLRDGRMDKDQTPVFGCFLAEQNLIERAWGRWPWKR